MSILPDSGWLDVLNLKGSFHTANAASCGTILFGVYQDWYFFTGAAWWVTTICVVFTFSFYWACARLYDLLSDKASAAWQARADRKSEEKLKAQQALAARRRADDENVAEEERRARVLRNLDELGEQQVTFIAHLLASNTKSFPASNQDGMCLVLKSLGIIVALDRGNIKVPYQFPDFVWEELQRRKDEALSPQEEAPPPQESEQTGIKIIASADQIGRMRGPEN